MPKYINLEHELSSRGFLTLHKFCRYLKQYHPVKAISYPTAMRLVKAGQIHTLQIGAHNRVTQAEINRWLSEDSYLYQGQRLTHHPYDLNSLTNNQFKPKE